MASNGVPGHYTSIQERFPKVAESLEALGKAVRQNGPLDAKTTHLIQLAAATASQSQGSVQSHAHRAVEAGATPDEVYHAVVLLVSTIGFPKVAASIGWLDDVFAK